MSRRDRASTRDAIIVLIGILGAILAPIGISLWAIYNEVSFRRYRGIENYDDLATPAEKNQYLAIKSDIDALDVEFSKIITYGLEVERLLLRQDGMRFDARKPGAKDLNSQLDAIEESKAPLLETSELMESEFKDRAMSWIQAQAALVGSRCGLIVFCLIFVTILVVEGHSISPIAILFGQDDDFWHRVGASLVATVAAGLALWGVSSYTRRKLIAEAST